MGTGSAAALCAYCGRPIYEEDDWWVDNDGNLVCEASDESLGPHSPTAPAGVCEEER